MKYTRQDLKIMQEWSLERKIRVAQAKIIKWYMRHNGQVFVSFSGGKDSTVLLDLVRRIYPDVPAVFVDTGLKYPELRDFVKSKDNISWLRPRYPFPQIIEKYGYPVISKEIADCVDGARKGQAMRLARLNGTLLGPNGKKSIYGAYEYGYTATLTDDIHVDKSRLPQVMRDVLEDFRRHEFVPCALRQGLQFAEPDQAEKEDLER